MQRGPWSERADRGRAPPPPPPPPRRAPARARSTAPPISEQLRTRAVRHRLTRCLLDDPAVYYDELPEVELAYLTSQRSALIRRIVEATGLVAEIRGEGIAMVDPRDELTDVRMPEVGTDGHVALLITEHLAARPDDGGEGCSAGELHALVRQLAREHSAYFITDQRVGEELALLDATGVALTAERLEDAIGSRGAVHRRAREYRRAIDERLFGLGDLRYGALIDLLIEIRAPQLSRRPDERGLSADQRARAPLLLRGAGTRDSAALADRRSRRGARDTLGVGRLRAGRSRFSRRAAADRSCTAALHDCGRTPAPRAATVGHVEHERLSRLLGVDELAWVLERARRRIELGQPLAGTIAARTATPAERDAVARLFGRSPRAARGLSVSLDELDALLRDGSMTGSLLAAAAASGEPVWLTLRQLVRSPPDWTELDLPPVLVVENPSVLAFAADAYGRRCPPIVCTNGQPRAATMVLLRSLAGAGVRLRHHGDFDWGGVAIGNLLHRRLPLEQWRFDHHAYLRAVAAHPHTAPLAGAPVTACWDPSLSEAMSELGRRIEEELVSTDLLETLT
ncbi:MAG: DUF2398 family protein [Solirubrobacteraceae bacterium]